MTKEKPIRDNSSIDPIQPSLIKKKNKSKDVTTDIMLFNQNKNYDKLRQKLQKHININDKSVMLE